MNSTLEKLKDVKSDCCVTIQLQTHRTPPGNQKDSIELKNLVRKVEKRLATECDKEKPLSLLIKLRTSLRILTTGLTWKR